MKICGIIAEYNPLHNGHVYQIGRARELTDCDYVVVCMSGDFVQRGLPAINDKYARTRMALECGIDAVIELPAIYATSSAGDFARCGVAILSLLGCDSICFGSETGNLDVLMAAAEKSRDYEANCRDEIALKIRNGESYVKAIGTEDLNLGSNDRLAIEYLNALQEYDFGVSPVCVKREGKYLDTDIASGSATAIRAELAKGNTKEICKYMPEKALLDTLIFPEDFSDLYYGKLSLCANCCDKLPLTAYRDVSANIAGHILSKISSYGDIESFSRAIHSGEYTRGRINRALLHILLEFEDALYEGGVKPEDLYARILGFRKNSQKLLSELKIRSGIPIVSKCADAKGYIGERSYEIFRKDIFAANMYEYVLAKKQGRLCTDENAKPLILC